MRRKSCLWFGAALLVAFGPLSAAMAEVRPVYIAHPVPSLAYGYGKPGTFVQLETAVGVGGFLGTLAVIKVGGRPSSGMVMLAAAAVFGLFIAGFAMSRDFSHSAALLFSVLRCFALLV